MSVNALEKAPWVLVWQQLQGPSKKKPGPKSQTRNTQHDLEPGIRNNAPNSETLIAKRDPSPQPSNLNPKPPPKPCFPGTGSAPSVGRAVTRLPQLLPARKTQGPLRGSKRIVSFCEKTRDSGSPGKLEGGYVELSCESNCSERFSRAPNQQFHLFPKGPCRYMVCT